jgi:dTMP kinase
VTRGRFITLEGGEGTGKSTQVKALTAALRERGLDVLQTREPGGSEGAEVIRGLLLHDAHWGLEAEALLFAAARADHVQHTIRPALDKGIWVVSDRFLDSSLAYQGQAGGLGFDVIRQLHQIGSHGFLPDRTLLLELPGKEAGRRANSRDLYQPDLIGRRDADYHDAVAQGFHAVADEEPDRFRIVDASGKPETVTARLLAELEDLL